jgi:hypothetical protein
MPGQATAPSKDKEVRRDVKKTDEEEEKAKHDQADLVTIEIAERQLSILAPQGGKSNGAAWKSAAKKENPA